MLGQWGERQVFSLMNTVEPLHMISESVQQRMRTTGTPIIFLIEPYFILPSLVFLFFPSSQTPSSYPLSLFCFSSSFFSLFLLSKVIEVDSVEHRDAVKHEFVIRLIEDMVMEMAEDFLFTDPGAPLPSGMPRWNHKQMHDEL